MNPTRTSELLERAAAAVTPHEIDPVARMVGLGRRSVRRRRAWRAAGAVAAVVAILVAVPLVTSAARRSDSAGPHGSVVSFGVLSVAVPKGWRTSTVTNLDACKAEPDTIYLGAQVSESSACDTTGQSWMVLEQNAGPQYLEPDQVVFKSGRSLAAEQTINPSGWTYASFGRTDPPTGVFIPAGAKDSDRMLETITWPADPQPPASGGLALPAHITGAVSENQGPMVTAMDTKTLTKIREALTKLRDPVPAGKECTLKKPGRVGIAVGDLIVVLGDATCPQAISTGGGRVWAPAKLGKQLLGLIAASDKAAAAAKN